MVVNTMGWLSEMGSRVGDHLKLRSTTTAAAQVGILAFETAKTMSRLLSLYKSLDEAEVSNLRNEVLKSRGVAYLNSKDESFLLTLACAERLEDLDNAASTVARLGHSRCSDFGLNRFDLVYTDLKLGIIDLGRLDYGSKDSHKRIEKMEKLVSATSRLYTALESLSEMEISERKLNQWRNINSNSNKMALQLHATTNFDLFNQKISYQRKQVRHLREISLWSQTFDKSVGLMARIVCIIYARICVVFGPFVSFLPHVSFLNIRCSNKRDAIRIQPEYCLIEPTRDQIVMTRSGPIPTVAKPKLIRFHSQKSILAVKSDHFGTNSNRVFNMVGPATVGGNGLTLRYANLILLLEKYLDLDSGVTIGNDAREALYDMLPENVRAMVRTKLARKRAEEKEEGGGDGDESLAEGWREAMREIMGWLGPVANDTVRWQAERSFEKRKFETNKTPVLLTQTLHFSDKEKVEAAVAEVLVGLSFIYRYENHWDYSGDGCGGGGGERVVGGRCSFDGVGYV